MRRSEDRILTTHTGSLHRPADLVAMQVPRFRGEPYDEEALDRRTADAVREIVRKQRDVGVDVVNDGELSKSSWLSYAADRLGGFEYIESGEASYVGAPVSRERQAFPRFYEDATKHHTLVGFTTDEDAEFTRATYGSVAVCTGPITYDDRQVQADIANLKAAIEGSGAADAFIGAVAPASIQGYVANEHYPDDDSYFEALARALHQEYKAITDAGLLVQIDDPFLPYVHDTHPDWSMEEYRAWAVKAVDSLNLALEGIPAEQVRHHVCWGSGNTPHATDIPLTAIVDLILAVNAGAYSLEAANARHAWEWQVWQDVKLPEGKILIPGVVEHTTNVVEHPETVAQRILNFATVVGRENVIAGTDCGYWGRIHPEVAWAKQQAMADGAALASARLWR